MSGMRRFTIPESIPATTILGEPIVMSDKDKTQAVLSAVELYRGRLLDATFGTGNAGVLAALAILEVLRDAKPGDVIALNESDWQMGCDSMTAPKSHGFDTRVPHITSVFTQAWLKAEKVDPKDLRKPAEAKPE
jgi:hypothetical protein